MQERRFFHILECFLLWDELCICQCNVIDKHKCLLDKMKEDRIFSICFENNAVYLNEQCDDYFSHQLTKEDCLELSSLFGELATVMNRR